MIDRWLPPEQRRRRLAWLLALSLAALTAVAVRASISQVDTYGQQMSPTSRNAVMSRSVELATRAMSFHAASAAADVAAVKDTMTEQMREDYDRTLPPAADWPKQGKADVRVDARVARLDRGKPRASCPQAVCAVGITSLTSDRATVLLFVNQYASAKTTKNTVVNPTWEVLRLVRRDGQWIIAGMEAP